MVMLHFLSLDRPVEVVPCALLLHLLCSHLSIHCKFHLFVDASDIAVETILMLEEVQEWFKPSYYVYHNAHHGRKELFCDREGDTGYDL